MAASEFTENNITKHIKNVLLATLKTEREKAQIAEGADRKIVNRFSK